MSECVETITDQKIKDYWKSFFLKSKSKEDIENILNNVSNKKFDDLIEEYYKQDNLIVESMMWKKSEKQEVIDEVLNDLKDNNLWGNFYEPILKKYIENLFLIIEESNIISDKNIFIRNIISNIMNCLHTPAFQTIIVETYYAKKDNILKGKDKYERGEYYNEVLLKDDSYRKEIYECYPELIRVLDFKVKNIMDFIIKIIKNTEKYKKEIEKTINKSGDLGKITDISMGEGDTHNNCKTVSIIKFSTGKKVVYKPHKLDVEEKYYEFIEWFNRNSHCKLMAAKSFSKEDEGWMEFIEQMDCKNEKEVSDFYYRIGTLLCILYTTNAVDIHNENLISYGDMPVLVDLETFMNGSFLPESEEDSANIMAIKLLDNSVIKNAFLPTYLVNKKTKKIIDLGGLSAGEDQESPFAAKFIKDYGTDEVRVELSHSIIEAKDNNASIEGKAVDSKLYKDNIVNGFKDTYKWILKNKSMYIEVLQELFKGTKIRMLFRSTNIYSELVDSSYHPNLLTNSVDRFIFIHRLFNDEDKENYKIFNSELKDILKGDIPYFAVKADEKEIYGSDTEVPVFNLKSSILQTVEKKINDMNEVDLYRQISIINCKLMIETKHEKTSTTFNGDVSKRDNSKKFIVAAEKIGDYLLQREVIGKKSGVISRTWFGEQEDEFGIYDYHIMDNSLYYGLGGMALFFNYLEKLSDKPKYNNVSKEICATMLEGMPKNKEDFYKQSIEIKDIDSGAFSGLAGVAYVLLNIDNSNSERIYENSILLFMDLINKRLDYEVQAEVIRDVGTMGCMISIYNNAKSNVMKDKALEIAKKAYDNVKKKIVLKDDIKGITWTENGYVGYAHGNSGVVAQLYRLYKITGEKEILDLIEKSLSYEHSMYVEKENNWRRSIDEKNFSSGWCHGAPGILLSKIQLLKNGYKDELMNKEIENAIKSVIDNGLGNDWCLCHGDMGNLSILKETGLALNRNKLYNRSVNTIEKFLEEFIKKLEDEGFKGKENNGFMLGLSGVGYELLRIYRENEIPNILALE